MLSCWIDRNTDLIFKRKWIIVLTRLMCSGLLINMLIYLLVEYIQRLIWFENQTGGPKVWVVNKGGKASPLLHFVCRGWQLEGLELYEGGQRCEL